MKKCFIFGFVVALAVAGVFGWQYSKHWRDARLARKITGTWTTWNKRAFEFTTYNIANPFIFTHTISPDGTFSYSFGRKSALVTFQGTWRIESGNYIMTFTNSFGTGNHEAESAAGKVERCRIVHLDEHEFSYLMGEKTNMLFR